MELEYVMNQMISLSTEIANKYQQLADLEKQGIDITTTKEYDELNTMLKYEKSFYERVRPDTVDDYMQYIHKNYPIIHVDTTKVILKQFYFSPVYRVYARLDYLMDYWNCYNEIHTEKYNYFSAYTFLFQNLFVEAIQIFFEKANGIKGNENLIKTKYNLIFSTPDIENRLIHHQDNFSLDKYVKFMSYDKESFLNKMNEQLDSLVCDLINLLNQEGDYYDSQEFYNQQSLLELAIRVLLFLMKENYIKDSWLADIEIIEVTTIYPLLRQITHNIRLGVKSDNQLKLQLQKKFLDDETSKISENKLK